MGTTKAVTYTNGTEITSPIRIQNQRFVRSRRVKLGRHNALSGGAASIHAFLAASTAALKPSPLTAASAAALAAVAASSASAPRLVLTQANQFL